MEHAPTIENQRFSELWFSRDKGVDQRGTDELLAFVQKVYNRLLAEESSIFGPMRRHTVGIGSLRIFCRIDVSLFWDETNEKYQYCVNEVQEGQCGLFMFGDARLNGPVGLASAMKRGSLEG